MVNTNEEIGRIVVEYRDVKRRLTAIKSCMDRKIGLLRELADRLDFQPSTIGLEDDHFDCAGTKVPFDLLTRINEDLAEYQDALQTRNRLETYLRDAGLHEMIT